MQKCFVG